MRFDKNIMRAISNCSTKFHEQRGTWSEVWENIEKARDVLMSGHNVAKLFNLSSFSHVRQ